MSLVFTGFSTGFLKLLESLVYLNIEMTKSLIMCPFLKATHVFPRKTKQMEKGTERLFFSFLPREEDAPAVGHLPPAYCPGKTVVGGQRAEVGQDGVAVLTAPEAGPSL